MEKCTEEEALNAWKNLLGKDRFLEACEINARYSLEALGKPRVILAALLPETQDEVVQIVRIAHAYKIPLYPISRGNNRGYGNASPVEDSCALVDLSLMNKILRFDKDLGLVTVEPGVTFGDLYKFIKQNGSHFLAPTVGIGLEGSILGNILEKGRSGRPYVDRASSLMSLEVVLADGSVYKSSSSENGQSFFKWGIGPYLDGLFLQSNFGIVCNVTISLAPFPQYAEGFLFSFDKEECSMTEVIDLVRVAMQKTGSIFSNIKILSADSVISLIGRVIEIKDPNLTSQEILSLVSLKHWTVVGSFQGERALVRASRTIFRKILKQKNIHTTFFTRNFLVNIKYFLLLPFSSKKKAFLKLLPILAPSLQAVLNKEGDLRPVFKREPEKGMLVFSVVVSARGRSVESIVSVIESVSQSYGYKSHIEILNFSSNCFLVAVPLYYTHGLEVEETRVKECYEHLASKISSSGGYLYRLSVDTMLQGAHTSSTFWTTAQKIKETLDPFNIIAPGRYIKTKWGA